MTLTFDPRAGLSVELTPNGVLITESDYPEEDVSVFISRERIGSVIDFLNVALAELTKEGAH